jgi:hypothetical protein
MILSPAEEVRRWRIESAGTEAVWLVKMRMRLREGDATTRELADACAIIPGREFARFRNLINKSGCIAKAGETIGASGHLNIVWRLVETETA